MEKVLAHCNLIIFLQFIAAAVPAVSTGRVMRSPWWLLAVQIISAAAVYLVFFRTIGRNERFKFYYFLSLLFSVPFFGPFIYGATLRESESGGGFSGGSGLKKDIDEHIKAEWEKAPDFKNIQLGPSSMQASAVPIVDVLSGGDVDIKRKSIMVLQKIKSIKAIELLKRALDDPNVEIKFMSASALLNIESEFKEKIKALTDQIDDSDSDGYEKIYEIRTNLAAVMARYVQTGLLDEITRRGLQERIISELKAAIGECPSYFEARFMLATEYSKKGMYEAALKEIDGILKHCDFSKLASDNLKMSVVRLYCEVHYSLGDMERLVNACRNIMPYMGGDPSKKFPDLANFYSSVRYFAGVEGGERR